MSVNEITSPAAFRVASDDSMGINAMAGRNDLSASSYAAEHASGAPFRGELLQD